MDLSKIELKAYAIVNSEGKLFKGKASGKLNDRNWTDDIKKARVWLKPAPARSLITSYAKNFPEYGIFDLLELSLANATILDETDRVNKVLIKHDKAELSRQIKNLKDDITRLEAKARGVMIDKNKLATKLASLKALEDIVNN